MFGVIVFGPYPCRSAAVKVMLTYKAIILDWLPDSLRSEQLPRRTNFYCIGEGWRRPRCYGAYSDRREVIYDLSAYTLRNIICNRWIV
jgi:hypothetical protein